MTTKKAASKPATKKATATKSSAVPDAVRKAFGNGRAVPGDLEALWAELQAKKESCFFGFSTFGEVTLCEGEPNGVADYVASPEGDAWRALFREFVWVGEEADGGMIAYWYPGDAKSPIVVYLSNEGSLYVSGVNLIEHFAWIAREEGEEELYAFCESHGLPKPRSVKELEKWAKKQPSPEKRLDELRKP